MSIDRRAVGPVQLLRRRRRRSGRGRGSKQLALDSTRRRRGAVQLAAAERMSKQVRVVSKH